jgi:hypothetical protein
MDRAGSAGVTERCVFPPTSVSTLARGSERFENIAIASTNATTKVAPTKNGSARTPSQLRSRVHFAFGQPRGELLVLEGGEGLRPSGRGDRAVDLVPRQKLVDKQREGSKVTKRYNRAQTAARRAPATPTTSECPRGMIGATRTQLLPKELSRDIEDRCSRLEHPSLAKAPGARPPHGQPSLERAQAIPRRS